MNSIFKFLSFLTLVLVLASCGFNKQLAYFNSNGRDTTLTIAQKDFEPIIQTGDILYVGVTSLDPVSSAMFNFSTTGTSTGVGAMSQIPQNTTIGILVNTDGTIDIPTLGNIKVAGQTKNQLRVTLTKALLPFLKEPVVSIRFMNYRITVLGEVNRPGTIPILNERVSVLEALGLAGDLTMYGNRNNILLIHENMGIKETKRLSINDYSVFSSPYYYLQSNDVLYVEPNKAKAYISSPIAVLLPAFSTSISILFLVINSIVK
jgi:polysaccharide export outer membrane protein